MDNIKPSYEDLEKRISELELNLYIKKKNRKNSKLFKQSRYNLIKKIVHKTPNIFVIKDVNSVYVEVNSAFCEFLGKKEDDIIGKTDYDFFSEAEAKKYIDEDKDVMAGNPHLNNVWEVKGNAGLKWLKVLKTPIFEGVDLENPIGILCSVTDITEQKRTEISLLNSEKKLLELNAIKDKFFSIIGHDLRTPISNILSFNELLLENLSNYNQEKIMKFLKVIQSSANKSFSLLSDLLEWSKSQSNKIQIYKESINLNKILETSLDFNIENIETKKLRIIKMYNDDMFVISDKYILSTIFRNLISNAVKFTNVNGEIKILCTKIPLNEFENEFEIIVEDSGVGIDAERLNALFKVDEAVSTKGTNGELGTGLGLILCKEFLDKIGGSISVTSEVGKGSRFVVLFNSRN